MSDHVLGEILDWFNTIEEHVPGVSSQVGEILIGKIPDSKITSVYALADAWSDAGRQLFEEYYEIATMADPILEGWHGDGAATQFGQQWFTYLQALSATIESINSMADGVRQFGLQIELMKFMVALNLLLLAMTIYALIAAAFASFGVSIAGVPGAIASTSLVLSRLVARVLLEIAKIPLRVSLRALPRLGVSVAPRITQAAAPTAVKLLPQSFGRLPTIVGTQLPNLVRTQLPNFVRNQLPNLVRSAPGAVASGAVNFARGLPGHLARQFLPKNVVARHTANRMANQVIRGTASKELLEQLAREGIVAGATRSSLAATRSALAWQIEQQLLRKFGTEVATETVSRGAAAAVSRLGGNAIGQQMTTNTLSQTAARMTAEVGFGRELTKYLGSRAALGLGFMGGGNLLGQLFQIADGNRGSLDWTEFGLASGQGLVFGAAMWGGGLGQGIGSGLATGTWTAGVELYNSLNQEGYQFGWGKVWHEAGRGAAAGAMFGVMEQAQMARINLPSTFKREVVALPDPNTGGISLVGRDFRSGTDFLVDREFVSWRSSEPGVAGEWNAVFRDGSRGSMFVPDGGPTHPGSASGGNGPHQSSVAELLSGNGFRSDGAPPAGATGGPDGGGPSQPARPTTVVPPGPTPATPAVPNPTTPTGPTSATGATSAPPVGPRAPESGSTTPGQARTPGGEPSQTPPSRPVMPDQAITPDQVLAPDRVIIPDQVITPEQVVTPDRVITPEQSATPERVITSDQVVSPEGWSAAPDRLAAADPPLPRDGRPTEPPAEAKQPARPHPADADTAPSRPGDGDGGDPPTSTPEPGGPTLPAPDGAPDSQAQSPIHRGDPGPERGAAELDGVSADNQDSASGARIRPKNAIQAIKWAEEAYSRFRASDADIPDIARNLATVDRPSGGKGFSVEEIQQIKQHLMFDEHLLDDYDGGHYRSRFDPDEDIAEAWIRLRSGEFIDADLVLLEHELAESNYMRAHPEATYREAHEHANSLYNWSRVTPERTGEDLDILWRKEQGSGDTHRLPEGPRGQSGGRIRFWKFWRSEPEAGSSEVVAGGESAGRESGQGLRPSLPEDRPVPPDPRSMAGEGGVPGVIGQPESPAPPPAASALDPAWFAPPEEGLSVPIIGAEQTHLPPASHTPPPEPHSITPDWVRHTLDDPATPPQQAHAIAEHLASVDDSGHVTPKSAAEINDTLAQLQGEAARAVQWPEAEPTPPPDRATPEEPSAQSQLTPDEYWADPPWRQEQRRPSLDELIPVTGEEAVRFADQIRQEFVRQFDGQEFAGMRLRFDLTDEHSISVYQNEVTIRPHIVHPELGQVGQTIRTFHRDHNGDLFVEHNVTRLAENAQGRGFASEWNRFLEEWYRYSGVDRIEIHASLKVGGFAWARAGYDWAPNTEHRANAVFDRLRTEMRGVKDEIALVERWRAGDEVDIQQLQRRYGVDDPDALVAELRRQYDSAQEVLDRAAQHPFGQGDYPTPFEVAHAGWDGHHGRDATWIGKRALLGSDWKGVKPISVDGPQFPRPSVAAGPETPPFSTDPTPPSIDGGQIQTGVAVRPAESAAAAEWAREAYRRFRADDRDIPDLARTVAEIRRADGTVGFSQAELVQIKRHLFRQHHLLATPDGGVIRDRFHPAVEVAEAWIRLREGRPLDADIVLLEHELAEIRYGLDHPEASYLETHAHAEQLFPWQDVAPGRTGEDLDSSWGPRTVRTQAEMFVDPSPAELTRLGVGQATLADLGFPDGAGLTPELRVEYESALPHTALVSPYEIKFSQRSVSPSTGDLTVQDVAEHMRTGGWRGGPISGILWGDGSIVSLDNRRLRAARHAGLEEVPVKLHSPHDRLADWPQEWDTARRQRNALGVEIRQLHDGTLVVGGTGGIVVYARGTVPETFGEIALFRAAEQRSLLPGELYGAEVEPVLIGKPPPGERPAALDPAEAAALQRQLAQIRPLADQIMNDLAQIGQAAARQLGLDEPFALQGTEHRVKSFESLARKLEDEGVLSGDPESFLARTNDIVRFSLKLPDGAGYTQGVTQVLTELSDRGYQLVDAKNFWRPGNRFFGMNYTFESPQGQTFELQFHTDASWRANKLTHAAYEVLRREDELPPRRVHALLQTLAINKQVGLSESIPPGLADIVEPKDTSFRKWVTKNRPRWLAYLEWLAENERDLPEVLAEFGLDLSDLGLEGADAGLLRTL